MHGSNNVDACKRINGSGICKMLTDDIAECVNNLEYLKSINRTDGHKKLTEIAEPSRNIDQVTRTLKH